MVSRIKAVMSYYQMKPAQFSDAVGMQRSAVSHVLSGRNKPSLDFILRIKKHFPEINLDWLLLGTGEMVRAKSSPVVTKDSDQAALPFLESASEKKTLGDVGDGNREELFPEKTVQESVKSREQRGAQQGDEHLSHFFSDKIERILIFYRDQTFQEYRPRNSGA